MTSPASWAVRVGGRGEVQGKQTLSYWMAFGKVKGEEEVGCWFGLPDCLRIALGVWEKVR